MKKILGLLMIFTVLLTVGCGSDNESSKLPNFPAAPVEVKNEKFDIDVYLDATVSMQGYTTLAAGNLYRTLPDMLDELGSSMGAIKFYSFGAKIKPLEGREYRKFTTPEPYVETITAISNVVDAADTSHLSVIVTDLFESDADWSNVVQKIRGKFFENNLAVGVIGIKNSFKGKIFDVGLNAATFDYDSFDYPHKFRPFYLLIMGNEFNVKYFMEKFKDRQNLPNDTEYLLLVKNLSAVSNSLVDQEVLEMDNMFREDKYDAAKEGIREFGIKSFNDPATFVLNFKREVPLGACPFDFDLRSKVEVLTPENDEWQPLYEKEFPVKIAAPEEEDQNISLDNDFYAEIKPVEDSENTFTLKLVFTPDKILKRENVNFVNVSVNPTGKSYKLPPWVEAWSMANTDISPESFDGAKTVNLHRVLGSLKDSLYSAESPNLINLNFVFYER